MSSNHIFVIEVKNGGPADADGRIKVGDEILEVRNYEFVVYILQLIVIALSEM